MRKKKVAISSCLLGTYCRYDAKNNLNKRVISQLNEFEMVPFCPEDSAFGTPRPTMDLIEDKGLIYARSNETFTNLSTPIIDYAQNFFKEHSDIKLFIGKDRSPSCAVCSGKVYNKNRELLHKEGTGLMAQVALDCGIECWDSETYEANHTF